MVQLLGNTEGKARRKVNAKGGPASVKGRQNQVASRTVHGLRSRAPILVGLESAQDWFAFLEGYYTYYRPEGQPEVDLVEMIAYQAWVIIQRLIPHECQVTLSCLQKPNQTIDPIDPELIQEVMRHSAPTLSAPLKAELARLDRYEALGNGVDPQTPYTKAEVEELLGWLVQRVRERTEEQMGDQGGESDETVWEGLLDVDDGPWTHKGCKRTCKSSVERSESTGEKNLDGCSITSRVRSLIGWNKLSERTLI
jgi:hypothetical protein